MIVLDLFCQLSFISTGFTNCLENHRAINKQYCVGLHIVFCGEGGSWGAVVASWADKLLGITRATFSSLNCDERVIHFIETRRHENRCPCILLH